MLGVRRSEVADCDALGRYRFEGLPRLPIDPTKPTDPMLYAINVYRVDDRSGAITATTDLGKQAGDIRWYADIRQDVTPLRSLVFDCEEFSLTGLYDPRYLQPLTNVIPLDAQRDTEPQRYGMWLFDEMLAGFCEPGARLFLPIRYGRVGNRMLLINTGPPVGSRLARPERATQVSPLRGFEARELNRLGPLSLVTATDFYNLDDARLSQKKQE